MQTILIVEDDTILSKMYQKKFELCGYTALITADGEEGIAMALQHRPNCILLDIMMPKIDGISVMDSIRKTDWGKDVPIVILTNLDSTDAIIQKVVADHPSYYILKTTTTPEEIVEKVQTIIQLQN